jgi:hypothetical protein
MYLGTVSLWRSLQVTILVGFSGRCTVFEGCQVASPLDSAEVRQGRPLAEVCSFFVIFPIFSTTKSNSHLQCLNGANPISSRPWGKNQKCSFRFTPLPRTFDLSSDSVQSRSPSSAPAWCQARKTDFSWPNDERRAVTRSVNKPAPTAWNRPTVRWHRRTARSKSGASNSVDKKDAWETYGPQVASAGAAAWFSNRQHTLQEIVSYAINAACGTEMLSKFYGASLRLLTI